MKKMILLLLVFCLLLCGCDSADEIPTEETELWVVTELTEDYGMNDQANRMIKAFADLYPNVTVRLDILPTGAEERVVYLEKIRTSIMAGEGPDVYLLPTNNLVPNEASMYGEYKQVVPLFRDVKQTMYNGIFYDISEYYDDDEALEKEELNNSVMEAGIMNGARYVLPLRYDIGIYLVHQENLEALGGDISAFDGTVRDVMEMAFELGDKDFIWDSSATNPEYYFSVYNDYETGKVALTAEEVAEYMRLKQEQIALCGYGSYGGYATAEIYIQDGTFFSQEGYAVYNTQLTYMVDCIATAKMLEQDIEIYPQRASDGSLNAVVRYYAAVGANTAYPKLAYEFIRLFLEDEAQYETYLADRRYERAGSKACIGWPVRTVGSVEPRFANLQISIKKDYLEVTVIDGAGYRSRAKKYQHKSLTMTDEDIPAVIWEVDNAWFPVIMENGDSVAFYLGRLNDSQNNKAPADVDINALARELIDRMQLYLDEG